MLRVALNRKIYIPECLTETIGYAWALKQEKYITRVFVFRPCLFHIEGVLMSVFVSVNTCRNPEGITQGS